MKKLFALAALVLGLASCQTEPEGLDVNVGGEVETTVCVSLPETTRANSEVGAIANLDLANSDLTIRYILQVFYGETATPKQYAYSDGTNVAFDVRLVPGRDYKFVVWADIVKGENASDNHYNTNDLTAITFNGDWNAMDETFDAYTAVYDTAKELDNGYQGSSNINISLTRPFAKLRVITTDMVELGNLGIVPEGVNVKYTVPVYNTFNALAGAVNTNYNVTEKTFSYNLSDTDNVEQYDATATSKTLFTNYLFGAENGVIKFEMDVTDNTTAKDRIKFNNFSTDIPVQRNYLTTISGNILTDGNNIKVEVENDGAFEGEIKEEIVEVGNATDLQEAINKADEDTTIVLGGDINLNDGIITFAATRAGENAGLIVPAEKIIVLDLNGYTISARDYATAGYALITNKGNLTINGEGTLKITGAENNRGWGAYSSVISNQVGGNLTVNAGVTIEHLGGTDMAYGIDNLTNGKGTSAIVTINGATVKSTYRPIRQFLNGVEATNELYVNKDSRVESTGGNKAIWMQDPSKNANTGKLVVAEGAFVHSVYLDVTPGSTEWPVEVSVAASALTDSSENKGIYTDGIPAGYEVVLDNGVYTVLYTCAAKIGDVEYPSLQAAVEAVKDGETIVLNRDIEQFDGVIITDKKITIDLNEKIFTVSEGASTNNRNFKVNGSSVVTIKNGTMIAAGEYSSGAYGTLRTEGTANVTLEDVKLYNYRGNGLNVKVCKGTTVTINDTEIYSQYGGGVEAAGGIVELNDVKIEQKGMYTAPYNSMAISVNGGGTATVNSGTYSTECITAEEANNQGTSHGPWCAGVLNSGGTLIIKGGTFSNDNFGDNALATYARGLLLADTGAQIQIEGGTFNALKKIIDIQNNLGDASRNPSVTISGGNFSANPLTWEGLISLAEGYIVEEKDGAYKVVKDVKVAKVGNVEYSSIDEAIAAWTNNSTLTLLNNVTLSDVVKIKSTEHHTLDLGIFTLTAAEGKDAIEVTCNGRSSASYALTVNADATNPGGITAKGKACIYYKKSDSTKDRPIIRIYNGVFNGSYSINSISNGNTNCPQFWIYGGTFNAYVNLTKNMLQVYGGTFHGSINCTGDQNAYRLIAGGRFKSWQFMTADAPNKFAVSSVMSKDGNGNWIGTYDVGCYVDDEGYLVVGGPVITEFGDKFAAKATNYSKWSSYLKYSSAATNGLYYTNAEMAIKKHGEANVVLK